MGWSEDRHIEYAIADWLRKKRESFGLSQGHIGLEVEVSHVTVFSWESGGAWPGTITRLRSWISAHQDPETGKRCRLELTLVDTNGDRHNF